MLPWSADLLFNSQKRPLFDLEDAGQRQKF